MEEIEDVALNIERAADRMRAYDTSQAEKRKTLEGPSEGDLIMIRDFSKAGLTPNWEPTAYKCGGYNNNRTQIIVQDAVGKQWYEAIEHMKPYKLDPDSPTLAERGQADSEATEMQKQIRKAN